MERIDEVKHHFEIHGVRLKKDGNGYKGKCPAHEDRTPSLHIFNGDKKVQVKCHGPCSEQDVIDRVQLSLNWLFFDNEFGKENKPKRGRPKKTDLVAELCQKKKLPIDFVSSFGFENYDHVNYETKKKCYGIKIPYKGGRGRVRPMFSGAKPFWDTSSKEEHEKLMRCYKPQEFKSKMCFIVEGETDTLTLVYHGYDAIGIPGASNYRKLHHSDIAGIEKIFIVSEADGAGKKFPVNVSGVLHRIGYKGKLHVIDMSRTMYKDVNEAHCDRSINFKNFLKLEMDSSTESDSRRHEHTEIGDSKTFQVFRDRIVYVEKKTSYGKEIEEHKTIINQKVEVESIHKDIFNNKYNVTLKWGKNESKAFGADVLLFGKNHSELAKYGIFIDSNNQNYMASYFRECLNNRDHKESSTRNGWHDEEFVYGDKVISKDGVREIEFSAIGYTPMVKGDKKRQTEAINSLISDRQIALKVGAAAISPFVEKIGCENFTYHSWGDSSRGKTTGSKLGASLYSRPMTLLESWKSSIAGIETIMEEAGGLPVFLEESHKGRPETVVDMNYSFANKKSPAKSQLNKLLQRTRRESPEMLGVIISTGESEISSLTADGGATARILEQHKTKITEEGYAEKIEKSMADIDDNYGHFGEEIIKYFLNNREEITEKFNKYKESIRQYSSEGLQYRQIPYFAACIVGCEILRDLGIKVPSYEELFSCCLETISNKPKSLYDKALEHVMSCIDIYKNNFIWRKLQEGNQNASGSEKYISDGSHIRNECYGMIDFAEQKVHIYPKIFDKFIEEKGMKRYPVLQAFKEKNRTEYYEKGKEKRLTNKKWFDGSTKDTVSIIIPEEYHFTEEDDNNDDPQPPKPEPKQKEAEPEQEILAPYLAEGYGVDTFEEHKMGIVYDFHYEEKTICHKLVEDDAQLPQIASKIFAAHKNEALERKREEALKTESVVTKDMLADADTSESSLFELEETQYEDERGM